MDKNNKIIGVVLVFRDITERRRAEIQITRQSNVLDAVNQIFKRALTCKTLRELGETCLNVCEKLAGSRFGFIGELNSEGLFDTFAISNPGWDTCKMPGTDRVKLTKNMKIRGVDRSTLREEKSRIVNDLASHPDRIGTPKGHPPITSFLGVPLKEAGKTIGMIGLGNKESGYDTADQENVETLAAAIVEALMRKRAEEALQKSYDELELKVNERTLELREVNEQLKIKIAEHIKLHDQLIRSERLAATGQLAVSVAHEINSPLQAVTSMLNTLKKAHKEDKKLLDNIDLLKGSFGNIRDTVKHLLNLNRPDKGRKQSANINKIIEDTVRLVRSHLKSSRIKLNLSLSSSVPDISVLTQQMSQVFLNLINNAVEAVTGRLRPKDKGDLKSKTSIGGEITVKTDYSERDIILTVSDNGSGILEEDLEHIFDPFYTRKKQLGMGIGLSICHDIIEDHNGTIEAKNSEEGGAVITITLPVSKK